MSVSIPMTAILIGGGILVYLFMALASGYLGANYARKNIVYRSDREVLVVMSMIGWPIFWPVFIVWNLFGWLFKGPFKRLEG